MKFLPTWVQTTVAHTIAVTAAVTISCTIVYLFAETFYLRVEQRVEQRVWEELHGAVSRIMAAEETAAIYGPSKLSYSCIDAHLDRIRHERTLDSLLVAFRSCHKSFTDTFGPLENLSEGLRFGAFLTLVSSRIAPYGESQVATSDQSPPAIINNFLSAKALICSEQMALVANALKLAFPNVEVYQVGVVNNAINHAMVFASDNTGALLLDPTTSVVAAAPLQDILSGKPVDIYEMVDYYEGNDELLEQFRRKLRGALRNGAIRQEDVIYNNRL